MDEVLIKYDGASDGAGFDLGLLGESFTAPNLPIHQTRHNGVSFIDILSKM